MNDPITYTAALLLGFFSVTHCFGMCGGLMSAFSLAIPEDKIHCKIKFLIVYNIGRLLTYGFFGLTAGFLIQSLSIYSGLTSLRIISGVILIIMALSLMNIWQGIKFLERAGKVIWPKLQPLSKKIMPIDTTFKALLLGMIWGWLPCGLVYSVLIWAATLANPLDASLAMIAFGIGTLPAMITIGIFANTVSGLSRKKSIRFISGSLILSFGCWTIYGALLHSHGHQHSHTPASSDIDHSHHH